MDFVASVVSGMAGLTQQLEDGRTQMVGLLLPSDFLGRPGRDGRGLYGDRDQRPADAVLFPPQTL
jgi:CRP-like cAMP-binding protein